MLFKNINQLFIDQMEKNIAESDFSIIQDSMGYCTNETCNHVSHSPLQEFLTAEIKELAEFWSNSWLDLRVSIYSYNDEVFIVYREEDMGYHYIPKYESFIVSTLKEALEKALEFYKEDSKRYQPKKELLKYYKRF
jgi:hypothetical protein